MSNNNLSHHGILGMKWGVRRYQNEDGTLTTAGKRREKVKSTPMSDEQLISSVKRMNLEKQYRILSKESAKPSKLDTTKKVVDSTSNLVNQAKNLNREALNSRPKVRLNLSAMTDQQLRDQINRYNLERQYNDIFNDESVEMSKGRAFATKSLEVGGAVLAVGSSALAIALAIKELKK